MEMTDGMTNRRNEPIRDSVVFIILRNDFLFLYPVFKPDIEHCLSRFCYERMVKSCLNIAEFMLQMMD